MGAPRAPGRSQRLQSGSESLPTRMPGREQFTEIKQLGDESREVGAAKSLLRAVEKLKPSVSLSARYVISLSAANNARAGSPGRISALSSLRHRRREKSEEQEGKENTALMSELWKWRSLSEPGFSSP